MHSIHAHTARTIDQRDKALADYKGRALLIVNTASECGFTPQYEKLQRLHERYQHRGFAVLGFPCNDFGGQEPGAEAAIKSFCQARYGVTFPLFAKVRVLGEDKHPIYETLTRGGQDVRWNFTKFLVDPQGVPVARFEPGVDPLSPELCGQLEEVLPPGEAP
jgi:glutathione peroxidase